MTLAGGCGNQRPCLQTAASHGRLPPHTRGSRAFHRARTAKTYSLIARECVILIVTHPWTLGGSADPAWSPCAIEAVRPGAAGMPFAGPVDAGVLQPQCRTDGTGPL